MKVEYLNLFGEPLKDDIKDVKEKCNISGLKSEVLFIAGINKLLGNNYLPILNNSSEMLKLFNIHKDDIIKTCQYCLDNYNEFGNINYVKKSTSGKTDTTNWFYQISPSKSDIICYDNDDIASYKISMKLDEGYQLTSSQIFADNYGYDSDLVRTLLNSYGVNCEWVNWMINEIKELNKSYDIRNIKGHLKELPLNIRNNVESVGKKLLNCINENIDISSECGKKFIMEIVNGNIKFGKSSLSSANRYLIINYKNHFARYYNDNEYYDYLLNKVLRDEIKFYFSFKTNSTSGMTYDFRIGVK